MRACVGLGACAWVSTFHCLILADCFCVVIWSLLEEGGRKQACSGLFFHGPPHKHFKIWSCFIYRSSHPHHRVMVTTFRGWKGMMCLRAHGIDRVNVCVNIAVMQRTQAECVYRVQYTCWSVSNACRAGAHCKNLVSVRLFHMQRGKFFFSPCCVWRTPLLSSLWICMCALACVCFRMFPICVCLFKLICTSSLAHWCLPLWCFSHAPN